MKDEVTYNGMTFVPYINSEKIQARVAEMAKAIESDCHDVKPIFLCVLTGAFPFASDLFRKLDIDAEIAFIRLKSYEGTSTSGKVKEVLGLSSCLEDRTVIVVEDIIDTGNTMQQLLATLQEKKPKEVKVATLLFKPTALQQPINPDYVGFEIPQKFIVGYGLDIDGLARNLNDIYILKDK